MILTKGYVDGTTGTLQPEWNHAAVLVLRCCTVPPNLQKRKGFKGSVDLEKIKCVETVQPEPNAPQERMHAFQVNSFISLSLKDCPVTIMLVKHKLQPKHCKKLSCFPISNTVNYCPIIM